MFFSKRPEYLPGGLCPRPTYSRAWAFDRDGLIDTSAAARYVGPSPGRAIDQGIYTILFAIALGTLAKISFQIKRVLDKP